MEMSRRTPIRCARCDKVAPSGWSCRECNFPIFNYSMGYSLFPVSLSDTDVDPVDMCCICLGDMESGMRIERCGHVYHAECLDTWLGDHMSCPICRVHV